MHKIKYPALLLALAMLVLPLGACAPSQQSPQTNEPPQEQQEQENTQEGKTDFLMPLPAPKPEKEAEPTVAEQMLQRLAQNIANAQWAAIRLKDQDVQTKIDITPQLLEEISYLLCDNYTVLTGAQAPQSDHMESEIMFQVKQENSSSIVQVFRQRNEDGDRRMIAWVQEGEVVARYAYSYDVFQALEEAIENNQYENDVQIDGNHVRVRSAYDMEAFSPQRYSIDHFFQFNDILLYCYSANSSSDSSYFELIDGTTGKTINHFQIDEPIVAVETTVLEGYDFKIVTPQSLYYYNAENIGQTMALRLPENILSQLTQEGGQYEAKFDYDHINNLLTYVSEEGVVLSNRDGSRHDLLLRHDRLPQALAKAGLALEEDAAPRYSEPHLLNNGYTLVCPIVVPGGSEMFAGITVFSLRNGTYRDYITEFAPGLKELTYPDNITVVGRGQNTIFRMDVPSGSVSQRPVSSAVGDEIYTFNSEDVIVFTQDMNYNGELLLQKAENPQSLRVLLNVKGDYFDIVGVSQNYVLCRYADIYGTRMILVHFN